MCLLFDTRILLQGNAAQEFFDNLLSQVYLYSDGSSTVIVGDFNARLGTSNDYNEILDQVPQRTVLDTDRNQQGENFREYLKDSLQCVLNGRVCREKNNYTCLSWRGRSVVDYTLVPYSNLDSITDFCVKTVTGLIQEFSVQPPSRNVPDQSVLLCTVELSDYIKDNLYLPTIPTEHPVNGTQNTDVPCRKYSVDSVPINIFDSARCCSALVNVIKYVTTYIRLSKNCEWSLWKTVDGHTRGNGCVIKILVWRLLRKRNIWANLGGMTTCKNCGTMYDQAKGFIWNFKVVDVKEPDLSRCLLTIETFLIGT